MSQYLDSFVCVLLASRIIAAEFGETEILPRDLLLGLFREWPDGSFGESVGRQLDIEVPVSGKLAAQLGGLRQVKPAELYGDLPLTVGSQSILNQATNIASERRQRLQPMHVLLAIWHHSAYLRDALMAVGVSLDRIESVLSTMERANSSVPPAAE